MHLKQRAAWVCALLLLLAACAGHAPASAPAAGDDDDDAAGGDDDSASGDDDSSPANPQPTLSAMFTSMGFQQYLDIEPESVAAGPDGFTFYYFNENDVRCFDGSQARVAVQRGTSDNVMLFLEGGGARWPGGGLVVNVDTPVLNLFKLPFPGNPLSDWNFVYVPYCDASLHLGNAIVDYPSGPAAQWGVRHTAAAVALMKRIFPSPKKALIVGSSAGGFGTLFGWAIMKSQYMDTDTYLVSDSGVGFWNPDDPAKWASISGAWDVQMPPQCTKCDGPIMTYMFETFMDLDPQVRIAMDSSYYDRVITLVFLQMPPAEFKQTLLQITGNIETAHPDRFHRFFTNGYGHTMLAMTDLGEHAIDGTTYYQWLGQLVNDDPDWHDLME